MIDGKLNSYCDWCGRIDSEDSNRIYSIGKEKDVLPVEVCSKECANKLAMHEAELRLTRGSVNQRIIAMHVILGHQELANKFTQYDKESPPKMDGDE